jgi:hypothetical protein
MIPQNLLLKECKQSDSVVPHGGCCDLSPVLHRHIAEIEVAGGLQLPFFELQCLLLSLILIIKKDFKPLYNYQDV